MKKNNRCSFHQFKIIRETTELEKKVTGKTLYVQCKICGLPAYCNRKDLEWVRKGNEK